MRSMMRITAMLLMTTALALAAACGGGRGGGATEDGDADSGSVAGVAKQRIDHVVRTLIGATRAGIADPEDAQVHGEGAFTRCGLGAGSTQYVGRATVVAHGDHVVIGTLGTVLKDDGFTVTEREGDLVARDGAGFVVVVHAPLDAAARPGTWSLDLVGSSPCAEYSDADNEIASDTAAQDYSR